MWKCGNVEIYHALELELDLRRKNVSLVQFKTRVRSASKRSARTSEAIIEISMRRRR